MKWNKTYWRGSHSTCHKSDVASAAAAAAARCVYCFSQYAKIKHAANCDLQFAKITSHLIEAKQIREKIAWYHEGFLFSTNKCKKHWYCECPARNLIGNGKRGSGGKNAFSMIVSLFYIISWQSTFKGPQLLAAAAVAFKCKIIIASASLSNSLSFSFAHCCLYLCLSLSVQAFYFAIHFMAACGENFQAC